MQGFRTWHEILMERLSDPEDVIGYLEVSLEEYLDDGDKAFFLKGIRNVIEAQGGLLSVSKQAGINPNFLLDAVNNGDMPPFHILSSFFTFFRSVFLNSEPIVVRGSSESPRLMLSKPDMAVSGSPPPRTVSEVHTKVSDNIMLSKPPPLTEKQAQKIEYWTGLCEHLDGRDSSLPRPTANASYYRDMPIGIRGVSLRATQTIRRKEISASLVMKGVKAIGRFYSLRVQEEEIEKDFGDKLEWSAKAKSEKRVAFRNQGVDPMDENDWPNQHEWLADTLEKLYDVFHPRLEAIETTL